jgi:hypothetical protein
MGPNRYVSDNCGPNDDPAGPTPLPGSQFYTWDQALDFTVGGHQLPTMAAFFRRLPWHTLAPDAGAIAWGAGAPSGSDSQRPFQKADPARDFIVAYLPQANGDPHSSCRGGAVRPYNATVALNGAATGHRAAWFNPRTAEYTPLATFVPPGTAELAVPADRPGGDLSGDWVLLVEPAANASSPWPFPAAAAGAAAAAGVAPVSEQQQHQQQQHKKKPGALPPPPPPGTSWVSHVDVGASRVRADDSVVGCFFVATQAMAVTHLCRLPAPASVNVEKLAIFDNATGAVVAAAATDALAPQFQDASGFICAAVTAAAAAATTTSSSSTTTTTAAAAATPAELVAGTVYMLALLADGCDGYYDDVDTRVDVVGGDAADVTSAYAAPPHTMPGGGGAGHCYGPLNFYFSPIDF